MTDKEDKAADLEAEDSELEAGATIADGDFESQQAALEAQAEYEYESSDAQPTSQPSPFEQGGKFEDRTWKVLWGLVVLGVIAAAIPLYFIFKPAEEEKGEAFKRRLRTISTTGDQPAQPTGYEPGVPREAVASTAVSNTAARKPKAARQERRRPKRHARPRRASRPSSEERKREREERKRTEEQPIAYTPEPPRPPPPPPPPRQPPPPPPKPRPKPANGFFKVVNDVPINIVVDGWKTTSKGGATTLKLSPGPHTVKITFIKTGKSFTRRVLVKSGKTVTLRLVRNQ